MKKKSLNANRKNHKQLFNYLNDKKIYKIYKSFKFFLTQEAKSKSIAVGVSGGPDSLALTFFSKCLSLRENFKVKFFIVDHRIRKNSTKEAKKVIFLLKKFSINAKLLTWKGKKPKSNIQSIARKNRFLLLEKECKKNKIDNLLLGHHIDDLYENFFIRLFRGSGLKGLTSFGKINHNKKLNTRILRPLIDFEKEDLIYVSKKVFNFYVEDPYNEDDNFQRSRIRKTLFYFMKEGFDKDKLRLTINNLKSSNEVIKISVENNIDNNAVYFEKKNQFILNIAFFNQADEVSFRSLSKILLLISKRYYSPRGKNISNLITQIKSKKFTKATLGRCCIEKINETLVVSTENL